MTKLPLLALSAHLFACVTEPTDIAPTDPPLDSELSDDATPRLGPCFIVNNQLSQIAIQAANTLKANGATGWSVVAMRRGVGQTDPCVGSSSGGFARSQADGYRAMTATTQIPIASQSKLITSVAATRILAAHGVPRTATIARYLPSGWLLGLGAANITFEDLLTHRTGLFNDGNSGYAGGWGSNLVSDMKMWLMFGVGEDPEAYDYANAHTLLLQLLAARIEYGTIVYGAGGAMFSLSGQLLEAYVKNELFIPHGIGTSGPVPSCTYDSSSSLRYTLGAPSWALGAGISPTTDYERCGFGRWNITPRNFALFLDRLYNKDLLGNDLTDEFMNGGYGFDLTPVNETYRVKGGNLPGGTQQWKNKSYVFPDGTVVMAQINSNSPIGDAVPDAYKAVMP